MNFTSSLITIFLTFLRLGLTSFGGPVAHLGYFRTEFVERQKWLDDKHYADIVALCHFLPGPSSSQVGLSIGLLRGGYTGAFAAWLGFTMPSALFLIIFAILINSGEALPSGLLQGLKIVSIAVVAQAIIGMAKQLCTDNLKKSIAALTAVLLILFPVVWGQIAIILIAGLVGYQFCQQPNSVVTSQQALVKEKAKTSTTLSISLLMIFFVLLAGLPLLSQLTNFDAVNILDAYYRSGSLVFGGGHVVMPLLQAEVVPTGWVSNDVFLAGYGVTQAMPGPLFTFAAFLGASSTQSVSGVFGGGLALLAIFLPSFLLVIGIMPFWSRLRQLAAIQGGLAGVNAAVVGLLMAAFYHPILTTSIGDVYDVALALLAFAALVVLKLPPWLVVIAAAVVGWLLL